MPYRKMLVLLAAFVVLAAACGEGDSATRLVINISD
jgi:hypothetical protein